MPVAKHAGDRVIGGTINGTGALRYRATVLSLAIATFVVWFVTTDHASAVRAFAAAVAVLIIAY